ncbi:Deoxyribodipyrimidine photo-lyase [Balamuthia mandrillaris]
MKRGSTVARQRKRRLTEHEEEEEEQEEAEKNEDDEQQQQREKGKEKEKTKKQRKNSVKEEETEKKEGCGFGLGRWVHGARVRTIKEAKGATARATGVVYWMSRDQRVHDNWALLHAKELADALNVPMGVLFCMVPGFKGAGLRQFSFMVKGLQEVEQTLQAINVPFCILTGQPKERIPEFLQSYAVSHLVYDFSPMNIGRQWKMEVASAGYLQDSDVQVTEVDAHNIVPVWVTSDKQEYAARTIRPKIHARIGEFLHEFPSLNEVFGGSSSSKSDVKEEIKQEKSTTPKGASKWPKPWPTVDWNNVWEFVRSNTDASVAEVSWITPGESAARQALDHFVNTKLKDYKTNRNDPTLDAQSHLSPYLHFGQLSAQRCILDSKKHQSASRGGYEAFFEELVVRRELADNYCFYNANYDSFEGFPSWAKESLTKHAKDRREYLYSYEELDKGQTHDPLWNAAQREMVSQGKMHGFMRMYWAKKILEWTEAPQMALEYAIKLNDRYELDGRDPNGYVGCAWSIGGLHDQGWAERPIFGKVRYMNLKGCQRKFNVEAYVRKHLSASASASPSISKSSIMNFLCKRK